MVPLLATLFILVPLAEAWVLLTVGEQIGLLPTFAIMLGTGVVGAWLAKREGVRALKNVQSALEAGRLPGRELVSGALVLVGGVLLLTPGFLTDLVGLFCLFPPTRLLVSHLLVATFARAVKAQIHVNPGGYRPTGPIDVEGWETPEAEATPAERVHVITSGREG